MLSIEKFLKPTEKATQPSFSLKSSVDGFSKSKLPLTEFFSVPVSYAALSEASSFLCLLWDHRQKRYELVFNHFI
jgi:hypothetical protein